MLVLLAAAGFCQQPAFAGKLAFEYAKLSQHDIKYDIVESKLADSQFRLIYGERHTFSVGYNRTDDDLTNTKFRGTELLGSIAFISNSILSVYVDMGAGSGRFKYEPFQNDNDVVYYILGASFATSKNIQ